MSKTSPFRKVRGVSDKTLTGILGNHAGNINGIGLAVTRLLRERRLLLVWAVAVTADLIWLSLR